MKTLIVLVVFIALSIVASAYVNLSFFVKEAKAAEGNASSQVYEDDLAWRVRRVYDSKFKIVCYTNNNNGGCGIFCVKL